MNRRTFRLVNNAVRQRAIDEIWGSPDGYIVVIQEETRNLSQNSLLHSTLSDIAKQVTWHGKKLEPDVWKRLCMAAWLREMGQDPALVPALDGRGMDVVFERTSKLSKSQCKELIEWCFAFGAEHGVQFGA